MFCVSISYKKTPLPVRQCFAFSTEQQRTFLPLLVQQKLAVGGVVVSTCNRSELYCTGEAQQMEPVQQALARFLQLEPELLKEYGLFYSGTGAVRHLFEVTCGFDSMVLGEDEIQRQVKEGYLLAAQLGCTNAELNIYFQGAFNCAKTVKTSTRFSTTPLSLGTLTANAVEQYLHETAGTENAASTVLVIGAAGRIGSIVAKNLVSKGIQVVGTSRRHHVGSAAVVPEKCIRMIPFDDRYQWLQRVSAVVSATTSPHYTLTKEAYRRVLPEGNSRLLVDLAVPYDIDRALQSEAGVSLLDVDYFDVLARENRSVKLDELQKAQQIVRDCVEEAVKKTTVQKFQASVGAARTEPWFPKMIFYLKDVLDSAQLQQVLKRIADTEAEDA